MKARRIFLFSFYIVLLLISAIWGNQPIKYALLALTILLILSIIHALSYRLLVYATQDNDINNVIFKNEFFNTKIVIKNRGPFIYPAFSLDFIKDDLIISNDQYFFYTLLPFKNMSICMQQRGLFRGKYKVGINSVSGFDFFGIMKITKKNTSPIFITIYPKVIVLDKFDEKGSIAQEIQGKLSSNIDDNGELADIREYRDSDNIRRVHWKLSARTENFMVKNSYKVLGRESEIILDLSYSDRECTIIERAWREDRLIETILSVCKYMDVRRLNFDLMYNTNNYCEEISSSEPNSFERVYNFFAEARFNIPFNANSIIDKLNQKRLNVLNVYLFTMNLSGQIKECAEMLVHLGHRVTIIYIVGADGFIPSTGIEDSYRMLGVNYYSIKPEDDIKLILENI